MYFFVNNCLLICLTTLFICFSLACPQSYPRPNGRRFNQDYSQDYDDWEFAANSRNQGMNRLNRNPNGGRFGPNGLPPYEEPAMHQIEDRSYDLAYGLGQGYGKKLGNGIKSGIGTSFNFGFNKAKNDKESEDDNSGNKKRREDP